MNGVNDMFIRFSKDDDKEQIRELTMLCFGDRDHCGILENLNTRYLLAFDDEGGLLGMTGLTWSEEYTAYEVDWTCTHPKCQKQGVMHELFKRMCALTDEDIYCSCWRLPGKEKINLYSLMRDFGFEEVIKPRVTWDSRYNCTAGKTKYCVAQKAQLIHGTSVKRVPCRCYEDLYLRKSH